MAKKNSNPRVPRNKEKLRRLVEQGHEYYYSGAYNGVDVYEAIAEYLIMKGVRVRGGADNGKEKQQFTSR